MARAILGMLFSLILIAPFIGDLRAAQFKQCASTPPSCNTKAGGWTSAEFPHAVVNGCDYIETAFEGVSGQFLNFLSLPDLTPACNVHDRCYYSNDGNSADTCNKLFYEAMLGICAEKYDGLNLFDIARNRICATWVAEIAESVHGMAENKANLPRARKSQEDYMKFIAKSCDLKTWDPYPCPVPKPGKCRRQGDETCCRTKCVPSCSRGKSKWEWQCSK